MKKKLLTKFLEISVDKNYGGVIWTKHALKRLKERKIKQGDAWVTWKKPDKSYYAKTKGAWIFYRKFGNQRVEVVAKKNEKGEWVILSVWSRTIFGKKPRSDGNIFKSILNFFTAKKSK